MMRESQKLGKLTYSIVAKCKMWYIYMLCLYVFMNSNFELIISINVAFHSFFRFIESTNYYYELILMAKVWGKWIWSQTFLFRFCFAKSSRLFRLIYIACQTGLLSYQSFLSSIQFVEMSSKEQFKEKKLTTQIYRF